MAGSFKNAMTTGRFVRLTFEWEGQNAAAVTSAIGSRQAFLTGPVLPTAGTRLSLHLSLGEEDEVVIRARVDRVVAEASGDLGNPGFEVSWLEARSQGSPQDIKEFLRLLPDEPGGRLSAEATEDGGVSFRYAFPEAEHMTEDPIDLPDLAGLEAIALPGEIGPAETEEGLEEAPREVPEEDEEDEDTDPEHDTLDEGEDGAAALEELAALTLEEEEGPELELLADFDTLAEAPTGEVRVASFDAAGEGESERDVADYLLAELQALERSVEGEEAKLVTEAEPVDEPAATPPPAPGAPEPEPEPESLSEPLSEPDFPDEMDIPMEIEGSSGLLSLTALEDDVPPPLLATPPRPEPKTEKPAPPPRPTPSRTHVHDNDVPGGETEVGSSLTRIDLPVRLQWSSRSLQGRTLQITPEQLRVEAAGVLPDLYTRVRVLLASSTGKRVGELSLWANVTRVRPNEDPASARAVLTLTLAVQNSRGSLRKYRALVRRARG